MMRRLLLIVAMTAAMTAPLWAQGGRGGAAEVQAVKRP